jgi:hypothetical protein
MRRFLGNKPNVKRAKEQLAFLKKQTREAIL